MKEVTMPETVTVACSQVAPRIGDPVGTHRLLRETVAAAAAAGAHVVVLPELVTTGYMFGDLQELRAAAEPADGPTTRGWVELAGAHDLVLVGGFAEDAGDGVVYNSAALVDATGVRAVYRKVHLWNAEKLVFTPGAEAPPVVETAVGRIGVMVCYDLEFPEWVRQVALAGADLLCAPVNWPLFPCPAGERPAEIVRVQAGASVNHMAIACADRVGTERGQDWLGGSVIVDADGFPATELTLGREAMVVAALDLHYSRDKSISERNDVLADRRPGLYRSLSGGTR